MNIDLAVTGAGKPRTSRATAWAEAYMVGAMQKVKSGGMSRLAKGGFCISQQVQLILPVSTKCQRKAFDAIELANL